MTFNNIYLEVHLSIIDHFDRGLVTSNKIYPNAELVASFRLNWEAMVNTDHQMVFAYPYFHLESESFWHLKPFRHKEGVFRNKKTIKSLSVLKNLVEYAALDEALYHLLSNKEDRKILRQSILNKYFTSLVDYRCIRKSAIGRLSMHMLREFTDEEYHEQLENYNNLPPETYEEERYVRNAAFRRAILDVYNQQCAITGLKIENDTSLVEACHIVPFSESFDDTVGNGIALCPNMHKAFDKGIISISDDYRVVICDGFSESLSSSYNLSQFSDIKISLPENSLQRPSISNLMKHRNRFSL